MSGLYYLQYKPEIVGNSMLWWRKGRAGYTCNIDEAHKFTKDEAFSQHRCRPDDVPWPVEYIDARTQRHAHVDYVNLKEARSMYP